MSVSLIDSPAFDEAIDLVGCSVRDPTYRGFDRRIVFADHDLPLTAEKQPQTAEFIAAAFGAIDVAKGHKHPTDSLVKSPKGELQASNH